MTTQTLRRERRASWGFSQDEAEQIQESFLTGHPEMSCPRCGAPLAVAPSTDGAEQVDLVTCDGCYASVLIREPAAGWRR